MSNSLSYSYWLRDVAREVVVDAYGVSASAPRGAKTPTPWPSI